MGIDLASRASLASVSEPDFGELLAAVLTNGSLLDSAGTSRDMVALFGRLRAVDAGSADEAVGKARQALAGNDAALQLLVKVDQNSRTDNPDLLPFGPVRDVDAGAVERLALLTQFGASSDSLLRIFVQATADFVRSSGGGLPPVIHTASLVQDRLGGPTLDGLRWRDEVVPHLLGVSFELLDLVAAGAGAALPEEWKEAEAWLTPWVMSRPTLDPRQEGGRSEDGFFDGQPPGAIHPLVLRILRPKVQMMLASPEADLVDEATSFNAFLADMAVAADTAAAVGADLFPPAATPGCALVAGAFILASARTRGVTLDNDGTIHAPAVPWVSLMDRVLNALIFGAESGLKPLPPAWSDKAHVKQLLAACPDWGIGKFGTPLRARAQARLSASLSHMSQVLAAQAAQVPSNELLPEAERVAGFAARPASVRSSVVDAVDRAAAALKTIQTMSTAAADARRIFEGQLASPVAEPTLPLLLPVRDGTNGAIDAMDATIATYLTPTISRLAPDLLAEVLDAAGPWAASVNQQASGTGDLPQSWVSLELWDGLRGRLINPGDRGDATLADALVGRLPPWLRGPEAPPVAAGVADIDVNQLRPALAAVAHLGLPVSPDTDLPDLLSFKVLRTRIDTLLDPSSLLGPEARRLFEAAWTELTLTYMAASSANLTLDEVFGEFADLDLFARRGVAALESKVAWESRAGLNALIALSRLADVTGAPLTALRLDQIFIFTPDVTELIASSVVRLLSTAPVGGSALSALPLALIGSELTRFARESAQALGNSPTKSPSWLSSPQLASVQNQATVLVGKLVERFADPSSSPLRSFAWQGGRAGRTLLLSVFQIELNRFSRSRNFGVHPLGADSPDLLTLHGLERTLRGVFCTERLLLAGPEAVSGPGLVPWWSLGYWSAPSSPGLAPAAPVATADGRTLLLGNWAAAFSSDVDALQLGLAAALEAAIPVIREGEEQDVDGLSNFALPDLSFQGALGQMAVAKTDIETAETEYLEALVQQAQLAQGFEVLSMLKKPLLFATSDAAEQVQAADAGVREAEADIDAAQHESTASEFEAASIEMLYQASEVEVKRQQVLKSISDLEVEARQLDQQAQEIEEKIAKEGADNADLILEKTKIIQQQADLQLQMAGDSRSLVLKQIEVLNLLLRKDILVTLPNGVQQTVPGQIAAMGLKLTFSLKAKLAEDEADARTKLQTAQDEEEKRRELERQSSFIKGILSFAGAAVGFVVGGPAGAGLGSSIAGAAGDLVNGIIEKQPVEDIMVGLLGDALSVAKAAGVNLDGLLAEVGSVAGTDADQLFQNFESSLKPIMENLPRVLDESFVIESFKDVDLNGAARLDPLVRAAIDDLIARSPALGDLRGVLSQAGVPNPIAFDDPDAFLQHLSDQIFASLKADSAAREAITKVVGMGALTSDDQVREAANRLSRLVVARLGVGANGFKSDVLSKWIAAKQQQKLSWNQVSTEGNALLEQLFPDIRARSEVQANVRMALLDPDTFQGQIQSFLTPWQTELDKRIAAVKEAGDQALNQGKPFTSAVAVAQARLDFILASEDKFGLNADPPPASSLLAFLQGQSPQRLELFDQLQKQQEDDEKAKNEMDLAKFTVDESKIDVDSAKLQLQQAQQYLEKAGVFLKKSEIEVREATLQTKVNELAQQEAEDTSAAQGKASQSAAEKVKASAARIDAAKAILEGRRAQYAGAKLRATESARIRESLSQPPLRLPAEDAVQGTITFARVRHADALDRSLRASRQILRLLRAAQIPESDWPRPDTNLGDPEVSRTPWSVSLAAQSQAFIDLFQKATAPSLDFDKISIPLGTAQVHAMQSPGGLKLRLRPGVPTLTEDDTIQQNILDSTGQSGRVIAVLLAGKVQDNGGLVPMTGQHYHPSAEYLGDRWVSPTELHFVNTQQLKASRVSLMDPTLDPVQFVLQQSELRDKQGDPRFDDVPGTPTSGTTVLRLINVNPLPPLPGVPIEELELTVLHSFFD